MVVYGGLLTNHQSQFVVTVYSQPPTIFGELATTNSSTGVMVMVNNQPINHN